MTRTDTARRFLDIYCSGRKFERLYTIVTDDLRVEGPLRSYDSASAYVNSLEANPPEDCMYRVIQAFENDDAANLICEFSKPGARAMMSQLFEFRAGKISRVVLIYDSAKLS